MVAPAAAASGRCSSCCCCCYGSLQQLLLLLLLQQLLLQLLLHAARRFRVRVQRPQPRHPTNLLAHSDPRSALFLPQVRTAYCDKVGGKILDLFRAYWGSMDRLEVSASRQQASEAARRNPP